MSTAPSLEPLLDAARSAPSPETRLALCREAVQQFPARPESWFELGLALQAGHRPAEAANAFARVLQAAPGAAPVWTNLGAALTDAGQPLQALQALDMAVSIDPALAAAETNRAVALRELGRVEEALAACERALALAPDDPAALSNRSTCRLLLGDLEGGFSDYENRWRIEPGLSQRRDFDVPLWLGEGEVAGKTVLIHPEGGFGDTINFCRYAPLLAARGASVVLEAEAPLAPALAGLAGVERIVVQGESLPPFDLHCPTMSLPLAFRTRLETIPGGSAYLAPDPQRVARWAGELGPATGPRIGMVWFGKPTHLNDHNRSLPLARFLEAMPEGAELVSLKDVARDSDAAAFAARPDIRRFDGRIADFADTAALASLVDLVVSVDTSAAHLSAALGRPTWILLPFAPDWRWLLGRDDSPWYPSVRLCRQRARGDWDSALAALRLALAQGTPGSP